MTAHTCKLCVFMFLNRLIELEGSIPDLMDWDTEELLFTDVFDHLSSCMSILQ